MDVSSENKTKGSKVVYPWREGASVWLWHDGPAYFERLLQLIEQARDSICVELYWFASDQIGATFVAALCRASHRGVAVYCLFDGLGSKSLSLDDRLRFESSGIKLRIFNPLSVRKPLKSLKRDHRKIWLFDQQVALVGGPGVADVFLGNRWQVPWRDVLFELHGAVVQDFVSHFNAFWGSMDGRAPLQEAGVVSGHRALVSGVAPVAQVPARLVLSCGVGEQHIKRHGLKRIRAARQSVWLFTGYFYPAWKLRRALRGAANRGVAVKLLLPGAKTDHPLFAEAGRYYYRHLLRHGVEIYEYLPRFQHMKLMVCDDWISFGSSNQDRWNQRWNLEANVEIKSGEFVEKIKKAFADDFSQAQRIEWETWANRPWWRRVLTYTIYRLTLIVELWLARRS